MFQQGRDLFGRVQAGSSGGLHHDARVLQNLLFGTLLQLATNDVCSPEEAQYENRNKNEIEEDQKFESPHKASTQVAICPRIPDSTDYKAIPVVCRSAG